MALNERQRRFAEEYIVDLNATQAAIRAGYSPRTAKMQGSRLMTHDDIQKLIGELGKERQKRTQITADRVLEEFASVAFQKAGDEQDTHLRYNNKLRALENLAKLLGMDRAAVQGTEGGGVVLIPEVREDE